MKDMALPVAIETLGFGLLVLPGVCGVMAPILPVETKKQRARDRQSIEATIAAEDLSARLRDKILVAAEESRLRLQPLVATGPEVSDEPVDARISGPPPDITLEVTVTGIGVRDDLTLSDLSARVRAIRTSDQSEISARTFVHRAPVRGYWTRGLDAALTDLSLAILTTLAWERHPDAFHAPGSAADLQQDSSAAGEDDGGCCL